MPDGPSFSDLYKIHEIVEQSGHGKSAMGSAGISKAAMSRFTRTANHQRPADLNLGTRDRRNSRLKTRMTVDEARTMIRQLVTKWLKHI